MFPFHRSSGSVAVILIGLGVLAFCPPAHAQDGTPGSRSAAAALVPGTCRSEIAEFCPHIDMAVPQGRSASICLKPFKSSLSLPCRRAVRAVSQ